MNTGFQADPHMRSDCKPAWLRDNSRAIALQRCNRAGSEAPQAFSRRKSSRDWRKILGFENAGFQTPTAPADEGPRAVNNL
jgi:hypothetical protein